MTNWLWVRTDVALAVHDWQLSEHGGATGVRDRGAFESALARPQNLAVYGEPDAAALAAAYAFGIARNHAFVDGNKRTAWTLANIFLDINHLALVFDPGEAVAIVRTLAAGNLSEEELAGWFRERIQPA